MTDKEVYETRIGPGLAKEKNPYSLIDLFSGAGGLTLGFTDVFGHHFKPVWANDFNKPSVDTYNANFGDHCVCGDIVELLAAGIGIPKADVVVGGPPCQGFSLLNKGRAGDTRNQLWRPFLEIVEMSEAKVFVMENVPQLLGSEEHVGIVRAALKLGFRVSYTVLHAPDYGVPQIRKRAFIVGSRVSNPKRCFPPACTHVSEEEYRNRPFSGFSQDCVDDPKRWKTVRDAIGDLASPVGTEIRNCEPPYDLHFGRTPTELSRRRYRAIPQEGMNRFDLQERAPELTPACWIRKKSGGTDLFGRLWWDRPAFTIRTEFFKPEKGRYLHPCEHRPITHREAARLQTFPDSFKFVGSKIEIAKQIGNAVPSLLAARIADCVYALLPRRALDDRPTVAQRTKLPDVSREAARH